MIPYFLDNTTITLLEELQNDFNISFVQRNIDFCEVFQKSGKATIYYNPKIANSSSIAHELLHVWLTSYNYVIGNHIYLYLESDKKLSKIFKKFLCDHISNCCDHYKMYPKFLELGYQPVDFLSDGLKPKVSLKEIVNIKLKFLGLYNSKHINFYIGSLFSIFADHAKNDYSKEFLYLKKLDSELFSIVSDFWSKWEKFDIKNIDPIYNSDHDLTNNFIHNMETWVKNKRVI